MRRCNYKVILIYFTMIIYTIIKVIFNLEKNNIFNYFINNIFWIVLLYITIKLLNDDNMRIKDKYGKKQLLTIFSILYIIIYFLLGLIVGYEYSPYSRNILSIIKNIISLILVIPFQEKVRSILISYSENKNKYFIIITVLFALINLNYNSLFSIKYYSELFKFLFSNIILLIAQQLLYTYISKKCGYKSILSFILPIEISFLLTPIFPKLDWFLNCIFHMIFYLMIYIEIKKECNVTDNTHRYKPVSFITCIPFIIIIIIFICFVMGVFKYRPVAVMSNSMVPIFQRGDIVIVKKINEENLHLLRINDIIEYRLDNYIVIHKIVNIEEENDMLYFKTKGDNNNAPDVKYVKENQVIGIVKLVIPKLGYPTVWLSELFQKKIPAVETGK